MATTANASHASLLPWTSTHSDTSTAATAWATNNPLSLSSPSAANGVLSEAILACRNAEYPSASAPMTRRASPIRSVRWEAVACVVDTSGPSEEGRFTEDNEHGARADQHHAVKSRRAAPLTSAAPAGHTPLMGDQQSVDVRPAGPAHA